MALGGNTLEHLCMSYRNPFSYSSNTLPQRLGTLSERRLHCTGDLSCKAKGITSQSSKEEKAHKGVRTQAGGVTSLSPRKPGTET